MPKFGAWVSGEVEPAEALDPEDQIVVVQGTTPSKVPVSTFVFDIAELPEGSVALRPGDQIAADMGGTLSRVVMPMAIGKTQMSVPWATNSSGGSDVWNGGAVGALDAWIAVADYAWSVEVEGFFENATASFATRFWAKFLVFVDEDFVAGEPKAVSFTPNTPADDRYLIHVESDGTGDGFDPTNCLLANFQLGGQIVFSLFTANSTDNIRWFLRAETSPLGPGVGAPA